MFFSNFDAALGRGSIVLYVVLNTARTFFILDSTMNLIRDPCILKMDFYGPEEFANPVPILALGVQVCEGIPRAKWISQLVTLRNDDGVDIKRRVCQNVDPDLIIETGGKPLGDDRVAVQIVESLNEELFSSANMWSLRAWHIKHVFLHDDVSLYDHD